MQRSEQQVMAMGNVQDWTHPGRQAETERVIRLLEERLLRERAQRRAKQEDILDALQTLKQGFACTAS